MSGFVTNHRYRVGAIFFFGIVFFLFIACRAVIWGTPSPRVVTTTEAGPSVTVTIPSSTSTATPTSTPSMTATAAWTATMDATQRAGYATFLAAQNTASTATRRAQNREATLIAQFPTDPKNENCSAAALSPDRKWLAESCGLGKHQMLAVRNKERKKWILEFKDFLSPDTPAGTPGRLYPKFWSLDGRYLYFVSRLDYPSGNDFCLPGDAGDGLFRLDLGTGSWVPLIASTNASPGYEIEFAPTGRRYATNVDGLRITDLKKNEVSQISVEGLIRDLLWSPDGLYLAYSVVRCGEQGVESSSAYIWDTFTDQPKLLLFSHEGILYKPELWRDHSTLMLKGEKRGDPQLLYSLYIYDLAGQNFLFGGTAIPYP